MHAEPESATASWDSIFAAQSLESLHHLLINIRNTAHPPPWQSVETNPRILRTLEAAQPTEGAATYNLAIGRREPELIAELVDGQHSGLTPDVGLNIDLGWQYPGLFTAEEKLRSIAVFDTLKTFYDYAARVFSEYLHELFLYERGLAKWWTEDLDGARSDAHELGARAPTNPADDIVIWSLLRRLEGLILYSESEFDEALTALDEGLERVIGYPAQPDRLSLGYLPRAVRAEILYAQGDVERAIESLRPLAEGGELRIEWTASTADKLSRWHDELGNREEAMFYYARFIDWWKNADESLQPRVEAARERLRQLRE